MASKPHTPPEDDDDCRDYEAELETLIGELAMDPDREAVASEIGGTCRNRPFFYR
jgi:hypothetical protein